MSTDSRVVPRIAPPLAPGPAHPLLRLPQQFLELLPVAAYACDAAGRILWFNRRATDLWGRVPRIGDDSELYCGSYKVRFRGRQIGRTKTPMAMALRRGKPIHGLEGRMERPDGSQVWATVYIEPVKDGAGKLLGAINCFTDTTELHRTRTELAERKARNEALAASERQLRRMASQLTMAEHAERRRISQILHDDLQQQLHSIQMKLSAARKALAGGNKTRALQHLGDAELWSGQGVETARRLTVDLSPPILKSEGLVETLDWLVTQMHQMHGLEVSVEGDRSLRMPDDATRVLLYQIVRELLFNIVKHAGTDSARVELGSDGDTLRVCVRDGGKGFDFAQRHHEMVASAGGFGLVSIAERLHLLGGSIEVDSAPGAGTRVMLQVPVRRALADAADPGESALSGAG